MEYLVLGLLIFKPMTIYNLNNAFKEGLSLIYSASYGSLQNALKKLLSSEWVTCEEVIENGRNKKIYSINQDGIAAFYGWMASDISEKKLETTILSRVYFLGLLESKDDQKKAVSIMIDTTRKIQSELCTYQSELNSLPIPDSAIPIAKYQLKTLNYGVLSHELALKWLDDIYNNL